MGSKRAHTLHTVGLQASLVVEGVGLRQQGSLGVHSHHNDVRQTLLQLAGDASERATRASAGEERTTQRQQDTRKGSC
jgi:hypothetical protein